MLEKQIEAKAVKFCHENGILTYKFVSPNNRGVPDRIFLKDRKVLFIEFKAPGKVPTELQKREMGRIWSAGTPAFYCDSADLARRILKEYLL